ncbi:MAG: substrate-binding domain-containing protein [Acidimicrobiales bacterium]|jgi:ribose transport system substrate-binding protein
MSETPGSGAAKTTKLTSRRDFLKLAGASAGALAASSLWTPKAFAAVPTRKYKIAIVPKGLDNPVFALAKLGLEQRASELGDVEPIFTAGTTTNTELDINVLEGLVTSKVDAIGISCNDPVAYIPVINKAISNGICVMCWDSDAPKSNRVCFYGVNSYTVGQNMGREMTKLLHGHGNVVIVSGDPSALNLNLRIAGVKSRLGKGITVLNTAYTMDDTPTAIADTEDVIRSYGSTLNGIIMVGGWALFSSVGATPLLDHYKGKIKVESFDPLASVVTYLKDGIVQSVWTQDYWGWGYESTTILYSLLKGGGWHETIPQPSHNVLPSDWKVWQARWAATTGSYGAAAKVWGEPAFTAPGPAGSSGPIRTWKS